MRMADPMIAVTPKLQDQLTVADDFLVDGDVLYRCGFRGVGFGALEACLRSSLRMALSYRITVNLLTHKTKQLVF